MSYSIDLSFFLNFPGDRITTSAEGPMQNYTWKIIPYKPLKICHDAEITTKNLTFGFIFSKKKDSVFLIFADFFATLFHSLLYSAKMERHKFYKN